VADDPDTLVLWESTAKGLNGFKDIWDEAVAGSGFIPFFWPWWKHDEYAMDFVTDREREEFRVGDTDQSPTPSASQSSSTPGRSTSRPTSSCPHPRAAEVAALGDRQQVQRQDLDKFNEEFPTEPEDAFLSTGSHVFEGVHVRRVQKRDIRPPSHQGAIIAGDREMRAGAFGKVEVPVKPKFTETKKLMPGVSPDWKFWIDLEEDEQTKALRPPKDGLYVCGVDVSGGVTEAEEGEPAFHAIEVIDHRTGEQVAEYSSRVEPPLLIEHVFLTAHFFNEAWLGIEITGGYGRPIARTIVQDWRYRFNYMRHTHDRQMDREQPQVRLGHAAEHQADPAEPRRRHHPPGGGLGDPLAELANEYLTYIRSDTGKTLPERGKFSDRLMAFLIAKQIALELPLRVRAVLLRDRRPETRREVLRRRRDRGTGRTRARAQRRFLGPDRSRGPCMDRQTALRGEARNEKRTSSMNESDEAARAIAVSTLTELCGEEHSEDTRLSAAQNLLITGPFPESSEPTVSDYNSDELVDLRIKIDQELQRREQAKATAMGVDQ
jgi:hypothetical protein